MIVVLTNWIACFRKHDVGIREEASFLVDAYGVQGQREALQRKLDANSFTSARYWSGVETEAARYVGRGQTRFVFDAAWDERLRARSLARAIEAARIRCGRGGACSRARRLSASAAGRHFDGLPATAPHAFNSNHAETEPTRTGPGRRPQVGGCLYFGVSEEVKT